MLSMESIVKNLVEQVPTSGVLLALVIIFVKFIREERRALRRIIEENTDALKNTAVAIQQNTDTVATLQRTVDEIRMKSGF